jgi:hypothetical protein
MRNNHEEKINFMRIAASIANMGFTNEQLDLLVCLYELVETKGGKGNIEDVVMIEHDVKFRVSEKFKTKLENKVNSAMKEENTTGTTLISYRKYNGSPAKTTVFSKPFNALSIEEIEATLTEKEGVPKIFKWWRGTIELEPKEEE